MEPPDLYRELLGRGRATEPELDAESREDLARLLRFLAVSERFDLFFLRFDADAVLDFVTTALRDRYGERLVVCALPGGQADVDPVVALMHAVRGAGTERPIFLLRGFDAVLGPFGERTMVLRVLNERRDLLPMHVPGPLIVALRPQQLLQLREHAADLWSIYTAVFSFRGLPHQAPPFGAELPWLDAPEDYAARIERLAVLPGDEATRLRAHLLRRQALALSLRGDAQRAEETWAAALTTARAAGEHEEQAAMLLERCAARAERGRHDEARQDLADARALASRLAGPAWPATIAAHAAHLDFQRGLYSSAAEAFASAHRFADAAGNRPLAAQALLWEGRALVAMGLLDHADERLALAQSALASVGRARDAWQALLERGWLARARGDSTVALRLADEAVALAQALDDRQALALSLAERGEAALATRRMEPALEDLRRARELFRELGDVAAERWVLLSGARELIVQAERMEAQGRSEDARACYERATRLREEEASLRETRPDDPEIRAPA